MAKVSCIIPAYNEGPRIENVLRAVYKHPLVGEVIVVDDHSSDNTAEVVKKFEGINLIVHEVNKGKSQAVVTGIKASSGDFLFFLDADLVGVDEQAISDLVSPVLSGEADISISLRINSPWWWRLIGIDYISGERVFPKKLLADHLDEILALPRFGLESFMNKFIIRSKYRIKVVFLKNVRSPYKAEKQGFFKGVMGELAMIYQIFRTIYPWEVVYQIVKMSCQKVN